MLFNSLAFALYLPVVFIAYWGIFRRLGLQNLWVTIASYVFYGWWDWRFLSLIALTTIFSFFSGILIKRASTRKGRLGYLWSNVCLNLGILGLFKYYGFFMTNLQALLTPLGFELDSVTVSLILPVGISFYTFQALSYSIDVYRNKIEPTRDVVAFFAFISFFPQLVAGPIERATNLLPQFLRPRMFDYGQAVDGCRQILWGLFKKMVVADNCAIAVNAIFSGYETMSSLQLWVGAILFTFQIYGDFSGYSDIAIGVAKLFNINLMRNFNAPYFSRDIAEFWRKWHISLTTWFRDYIYIPLGGSRVSKSKIVRNTFIVFLVSGLWHGAEWTFVVWGGYHAVLFLPLILTGRNRKYTGEIAASRNLPAMREATYMALTFLLVSIGWVIFRAENIMHAWHYLERMFTAWNVHDAMIYGKRCFLWIAVLFCIEWIERRRPHAFAIAGHGWLKYRVVRWTVYIVFVVICLGFSGASGDFIYFQF